MALSNWAVAYLDGEMEEPETTWGTSDDFVSDAGVRAQVYKNWVYVAFRDGLHENFFREDNDTVSKVESGELRWGGRADERDDRTPERRLRRDVVGVPSRERL